jgi:hypothetical protein
MIGPLADPLTHSMAHKKSPGALGGPGFCYQKVRAQD